MTHPAVAAIQKVKQILNAIGAADTAWNKHQANTQRIGKHTELRRRLDAAVGLPRAYRYGIDYGYYRLDNYDGAFRCGMEAKPCTIGLMTPDGRDEAGYSIYDKYFFILVRSPHIPPGGYRLLSKVTVHSDGSMSDSEWQEFVATFQRVWNRRASRLHRMHHRIPEGA